MFYYTRAYFKKLVDDVNLINYCFNVISPLIYIAYLIYAIFLPVGFKWANITLLAVTVAYLVFYLVTYDIKEKAVKATKKRIRHVYKGVKLTISAMTLGITIYGIYVASIHTTTLSIVLSCFMALFWAVQVALEIITYVLEYQSELFLAALEADKDEFFKPVTSVGNFVKKVAGKEAEPPKEPKKILRALEKRVDEMKERKEKKSKNPFPIFSKKKNKEDYIEVQVSEEETVK
jgi:hypothetical protein